MQRNKRYGKVIQGLCGCGNLQTSIGRNHAGVTIYGTRCHSCKSGGRRQKKDHCELCGFIPKDPVQLDVDHIDADPSNNNPSNLQTLCANCHRLKTKQNNDWMKIK
jgi:5-methylcytosine-specific restriction endonuclease McrA